MGLKRVNVAHQTLLVIPTLHVVAIKESNAGPEHGLQVMLLNPKPRILVKSYQNLPKVKSNLNARLIYTFCFLGRHVNKFIGGCGAIF